jgi:hypothetical protein
LLYDETYLYIGALLHADANHPVIASFTERNSPIYQQDSDFEVFIDPTGGSNQYYKEFEINAYNTIWNLMLDKPYLDGGVEYSARVAKPGEEMYYEVKDQSSATRVLEGHLNSKNGTNTVWSVEMRWSFADLQQHFSNAAHPKPGARWRINFSRVERKGRLNWTWQPQIQWNGSAYTGEVNMHLPNAWGYLIFGGTHVDHICDDRTWPLRMMAINVYVAQHSHLEKHGKYGTHVNEVEPWLDLELAREFPQVRIFTCDSGTGYTAHIEGLLHVATIRNDRWLQVTSLSSGAPA